MLEYFYLFTSFKNDDLIYIYKDFLSLLIKTDLNKMICFNLYLEYSITKFNDSIILSSGEKHYK